MNQSETTSAAGGGERYSVLKADHRRRIQAIGAAISRRDWSAVEQAHAEIRDAFDRPDIYDHASPPPPAGAAGGGSGDLAALRSAAQAVLDAIIADGPGVGEPGYPDDDAYNLDDKGKMRLKTGLVRALRDALSAPTPDLGALSAEAVAAAYYNCMIGDPKEFWPHHDGWAGKSETFKAKVRDRMAKALKIAALSAPTPDRAVRGEPVAWAYEFRYAATDQWQYTVTVNRPVARGITKFRNLRPLGFIGAAPAVSRPVGDLSGQSEMISNCREQCDD